MEIALCASLTYILQGIEDQREEVLGTFFFRCTTTGNNFSIPRGKKMSTAFFLTNRNQQKQEKHQGGHFRT
jgi:hypothetical protein